LTFKIKMFSKVPHPENVKSKPTSEEYSQLPKIPIIGILDNIRSLHNVGAMFRTSDAARIEKLFLCGYTGQPPRQQISKTALRTVEFVNWEHRENVVDLIKELKATGTTIYALEQCYQSKIYTEVKYKFPLAIIVGHEIEGVKDEVLELVDEAIHIPMLGMANSLNVATAYGVVLYESLRQFQKTDRNF